MAARRRLWSPADEPCASPGAAQDAGDEGADLISQMPDSVLSIILSFLKVKAAFKARMLSHRWRHLYPASVSLCFDLYRDDCIEGESPKYTRSELIRHPWRIIELAENVICGISGITKLKEFRLRCDEGGEFQRRLHLWMGLACAWNVEEINFNAAEDPDRCYFPFTPVLHSQTSSYPETYSHLRHMTYSHLRHLSLESCTVENFFSLAGPLTSLRTLVLRYVRFHYYFGAGGNFNHIVFVAPHLEYLTIEACKPIPSIQHLCAGLPYLKALHIKSYYPAAYIYPESYRPNDIITLQACVPIPNIQRLCDDLSCYPADDIIISNSNITDFFFSGAMKDISLSGLNFLCRLGVICYEWTEEKVSVLLATLPRGVPRLKVLKLGNIPLHCFQFTTLSTFKSLKEINLDVTGSAASSDIRRLLRILEYAPFLENFNVLLHGICEAVTTASIREMHLSHSCGAEFSVHSHLRKASVKRELGVLGTSDLELALSLLKAARSLELIELAGVKLEIVFEIEALLTLLYPKVEGIIFPPGCHCSDSSHKSA